MTALRSTLCVLFLFSITQPARAEDGILLAYTATESCRHVSVLYYSHSTHPGGNQEGWLNEKNRGLGFRCRHSPNSALYYTMSGLHNSQFGDTFVAGPGVTWTAAKWQRLSIEIGAELPFIYYESPRQRRVMYGFLPVATVGLNFTLPYQWGTIGYVQNHLADTGVKLYSIQYQRVLR